MYPNWKELWELPLDENKRAGKQIMDRILRLVKDSVFIEGDRLPPIHTLARKLHTTSKTIQLLYKKLKEKHIVEVKPGIGTFIAVYLPQKRDTNKPILFSFKLSEHITTAQKVKPDNMPFLILGNGTPERSRTSYNDYLTFFTKIVSDIEKKADQKFKYQMEIDDTMHQVLKNRGISVNADQFKLIPNGAVLRCIARALVHADDIIVMDSPNDTEPFECFKENQATILFCGNDIDGLNINKLKSLCKANTVKIVFVRPSASFPEVKFMNELRREQLIALSVKYNFLIICVDDNFGWWHKQPISPLILRKHIGNVIYIGPVNKLLKVTDKMSLIVGHETIMKLVEKEALKCNVDYDMATELAVARLIQREWITTDFTRLLTFYKNQQKKISRILLLHLSEYAEINIPHSGLHVFISLNRPLDISPIIDELLSTGLLNKYNNLHVNYFKPIKGIRLGYATGSLLAWENMIITLAKHIKEQR